MSRHFEALKKPPPEAPLKTLFAFFYHSLLEKLFVTALMKELIAEEEIFHYIKTYKKIRNSSNG